MIFANYILASMCNGGIGSSQEKAVLTLICEFISQKKNAAVNNDFED